MIQEGETVRQEVLTGLDQGCQTHLVEGPNIAQCDLMWTGPVKPLNNNL